MIKVLGLDIGGANTKAAFIQTEGAKIKELRTILEYFPIWKNGKTHLPMVLNKLKNRLTNSAILDGIGVTTTAELSDVYSTKKDGINHVLGCVLKVLGGVPTFVLDIETNLLTIEEALKDPLKIASANWAATGWMISQFKSNCIVIDVGSTSTSIIPVVNGKIAAEGQTDLEKLQNGELVYSGSLRTNVATIVDAVPVRGSMTRVSSELFSQSGDVHLLLRNITKEEYTAETCDGRGKTRIATAARLARVVCADTDMLTDQEIEHIAKFVYDKQVEQIAGGLMQVYERIKQKLPEKKVIVTGLGRNFLARKAAEKVGFDKIVDVNKLLGDDAAVASPSVGVALMVASRLEGKTIEWKQS